MITYATNFTVRRLTALIRQSPSSKGLSHAQTSVPQINSPAHSVRIFTYPAEWSEARLRCKIEKCRLAMIQGRNTHVVSKT